MILQDGQRFRPDEDPSCFEEIKGGLNRMTVGKFETILAGSGLQPIYLELNRNDRKVAKALNVLSRVPGLREYFTFSVHSVWQQT